MHCLGKVLGLFVVQLGRWVPLEHNDTRFPWVLVEVALVVLWLWCCGCGFVLVAVVVVVVVVVVLCL